VHSNDGHAAYAGLKARRAEPVVTAWFVSVPIAEYALAVDDEFAAGEGTECQFGVSGYLAGWLGSCPDRSTARPRRKVFAAQAPVPGRSVLHV